MTRSIVSFGFAAAVAALSGADAKTTVAVVEVGAGGVARRTTSPSAKTSVSAVSSFWNSLHDVDNGEKKRRSKAFQYPGMTVVPDLFKRADGGVAIGITGSAADLDAMPAVAALFEGSVGHFSLSGSQGEPLMEKTGEANEFVDASGFASSVAKKMEAAVTRDGSNKLGAVSVSVNDDSTAAAVDTHIAKTMNALRKHASEKGTTVVVYLVVEEEDGPARRRLEDQEENEDNNEENDGQNDEDGDEEEDNQNNNQNNNNNNWNNYKGGSGNNENEKTIFQIQYFNVVLWTSVGLTVLLIVTVGMTISMPLEPDTLLFGESAKMVGE